MFAADACALSDMCNHVFWLYNCCNLQIMMMNLQCWCLPSLSLSFGLLASHTASGTADARLLLLLWNLLLLFHLLFLCGHLFLLRLLIDLLFSYHS